MDTASSGPLTTVETASRVLGADGITGAAARQRRCHRNHPGDAPSKTLVSSRTRARLPPRISERAVALDTQSAPLRRHRASTSRALPGSPALAVSDQLCAVRPTLRKKGREGQAVIVGRSGWYDRRWSAHTHRNSPSGACTRDSP